MTTNQDSDFPIRLAAFSWLEEQTAIAGDVLPWKVLLAGFEFNGERVPLVSQQGIFKPRLCRLPLSLRTSPEGPYDDRYASDGLLHYRYRGADPAHRENAGLRQAMKEQVPLVYLHGHQAGRYHAIWPVLIVGDDPTRLTFSVVADDLERLIAAGENVEFANPDPRRAYVTSIVQRRLHQEAFRERVLEAYREQCALCRLRHRRLLDAAHIIPDRDPAGEPAISNGLALCKLHHAAFDSLLLTVDPSYRVIVRQEVLDEEDGPMLLHGLQELHGQSIVLPRSKSNFPNPALLARRLEQFVAAKA